ncbi:MAG: universal stress protein [Nitrospirae bacterium]|nr:universal stress protein [Nitrospirota bacterium]MBI5696473.1 universal stress protein [Nitrospirota bacterium]
MDLNRILVPISFAPSSKKAIRTAATLASAFDAKLYVMNVYKTPPRMFHSVGGILFPKDLEKERLDAIKKLDEFVRKEMRLLKVSVDVKEINVEDEDPVKAILRVAHKEEIDLMVLGHHEESKMERFLFGRNIDKLVDGAPCDVIVTRSHLFTKKAGAAKAA